MILLVIILNDILYMILWFVYQWNSIEFNTQIKLYVPADKAFNKNWNPIFSRAKYYY